MKNTTKIWIPCFAFICMLFLSYGNLFADEKTETVTVTGVGVTKEKAIKSAVKRAIRKVVGMYVVTSAEVKNSEIVKDEILDYSNGYVKSFEILSEEKDDDGLIFIKASVEVELGKLHKKLNELNIATMTIDTDKFKAQFIDRSSSEKDFFKLFEEVVIKPFEENGSIYDIKIKKFEVIEDYDYDFLSSHFGSMNNFAAYNRGLGSEPYEKASTGMLVPINIIFELGLKKSFFDSVRTLLKNVSKGEGNSKGVENSFSLVRSKKVLQRNNNQGWNIEEKIRSYELEPGNFNKAIELMERLLANRRPVLIIKFKDSQGENTIVVYVPYRHNCLGRFYSDARGASVGMETELMVTRKVLVRDYKTNVPWIRFEKVDFSMISGIGQNYIVRNELPLSIVAMMEREELADLKSIDIEIRWMKPTKGKSQQELKSSCSKSFNDKFKR